MVGLGGGEYEEVRGEGEQFLTPILNQLLQL